VVLPLSLFCMENRVCLSHDVQVTGATWRAAMMTVVGDLMQRTRDGRTGQVLSDQTIERSSDVVWSLYCVREDEEHGFFGWDSK
jgi:hypothetical protein